MLEIILHVDAPPGAEQGAKEAVAMALEHLGGVRVVSVEEIRGMEQMSLWKGRG